MSKSCMEAVWHEKGFVRSTGIQDCIFLAGQLFPLSDPQLSPSIKKQIREAFNIYLCNVPLDLLMRQSSVFINAWQRL